MDESFLTSGLDTNRYLKAQKLVDQFESQIEDALEETVRTIQDTHSDLITPDASLSFRTFTGSTLRTLRSEVNLLKENAEGHNLTFNLGVEWVEATAQPHGITNVGEGVFCYVLYKIKYGSDSTFIAVERETSESEDKWEEIYFGEEKWDRPPKVAPGIVYHPVASAEELQFGLDRLEQHFAQVYAPLILS
ncbi:hypothetical protein [Halovivax gelatinilyticus]|uniref:hypothetical protein n=1 Tax=Halovivax gelatinilyticus TaxID=2961597 RepID=UPI0020CA8C26|nr:hypothetical protein [Halovivax gelatinilyticus]